MPKNYFELIERQDDVTELPQTKVISEEKTKELTKSQKYFMNLISCHT